MQALTVVEVEVLAQAGDRLGHALIVIQVDLFVFDTAPQSLDEDVVQCASASIQADGNLPIFEHAGEGLARELHTLIRIEDFWRRLFQSLIEGTGTKIGVQRDRDFPRQNIARSQSPPPDKRSLPIIACR